MCSQNKFIQTILNDSEKILDDFTKKNHENINEFFEKNKIEIEEWGNITEAIEKYYFEYFTTVYFGDWKGDGYSFYKNNKQQLKEYNTDELIYLWGKCEKWWKDNRITSISMANGVEYTWNTIVYWMVNENDLFIDEFQELMLQNYNYYLDEKRTARIPCGICCESKILYTGCSCCNGNYICYNCYIQLENENSCPFCRCNKMIEKMDKDEDEDDEDEDEDKENKKNLLIELNCIHSVGCIDKKSYKFKLSNIFNGFIFRKI